MAPLHTKSLFKLPRLDRVRARPRLYIPVDGDGWPQKHERWGTGGPEGTGNGKGKLVPSSVSDHVKITCHGMHEHMHVKFINHFDIRMVPRVIKHKQIVI